MITLAKFSQVKPQAKFFVADNSGEMAIWTKINDDTAIADGYECSDYISPERIVAVDREDLKS